MTDIGASFAKLKEYFCFNYRGVLLERRQGGYLMDLKVYPTIEDVDDEIDRRLEALSRSLNRIKPVTNG